MLFLTRTFSLTCFGLLLWHISLHAQQSPSSSESNASPSSSTSTASTTPPPPQEPNVIEDGGYSIQPLYWLTKGQPNLRGGKSSTATSPADLNYPTNNHYAVGGEISIPTGHQNTLRISYFRNQAAGNSTATQDLELFDMGYSKGDYLATRYTLQNAKLSWDYLSYTFHPHSSSKLRFKTLYEVQFTTIYSELDAPFKAVTTDSSGNLVTNSATGTRQFFYPTLGGELEQALGHHFRWEAKASGFGLPHRADLWDAEASGIVRFRQWELLAGEKAFHFKTSPSNTEYVAGTLSGAYVAVRWYWSQSQ